MVTGVQLPPQLSSVMFLRHTATTEPDPLSLHDALPILPKSPRSWVVATKRGRCFTPRPRSGRLWRKRPVTSRREASDRKSTRLNSSHTVISYAVFCLKKKNRVLLYPDLKFMG